MIRDGDFRHPLPQAFTQAQHHILDLRQVWLVRVLFPVQKLLDHRLGFHHQAFFLLFAGVLHVGNLHPLFYPIRSRLSVIACPETEMHSKLNLVFMPLLTSGS